MYNIAVVFVRYDEVKYKDSFEKVKNIVEELQCNKQYVVVDNKLGTGYCEPINENTVLIGSDNRAWEFSAFDDGLKYVRENIEYDAVLFCNDSWENPGAGGSIDLIINNQSLKNCVEKNRFISNTVSEKHVYLELDKNDVSSWSRSHCFMLPKKMLNHLKNIQTYDVNFVDKCIEKEVSKPYFKKDAPLNNSLRQLIINWLSGYWHSAFVLENNWDLFKMKTLAFFNEISLSRRVRELENSYKYNIDKNDLIIFDVFDTCIFRKVEEPWQVFYLMGCDFNGNRQEAEKTALSKNTNINIYDIYSTGNLPQEKLEQEITLEKELCYQNKEIFELYKYAKDIGKEVVFLSDMYLPSSIIEDMLHKCGYGKVDVIVSNEIKARKDSGEAYYYLSKIYDDIPTNKMLVFGDNKKSDYDMAVANGLNAIHYVKKEDKDDFWYKLGFNNIGCIAFAYVNWLLEEVRNKKIEDVYFFSREGVLFKKIYDLIKKETDPKSTLLYLSRKSLNLPLLTYADKETFFNSEQYRHVLWHLANLSCTSTENYLNYFNLSLEDETIYSKLSEKQLIKENTNNMSFPEREQFQTKVLEEMYDEIVAECRELKQGAFEYFYNTIGTSMTNVALVDLGWAGSIQQSFIELLKHFTSTDVNVECFLLSSEDRIKQRPSTMKMNVFLENNNPIFTHNVYLIESLFNAPVGSCLKYTDEGTPVFDDEDCTHCEQIHKGVLDFVVSTKNMTIGNLKRLGLYNLGKILYSPSVDQAKYIGGLKLYSSGTNGFFEYIAKPDLTFLTEQYNKARNKTLFYMNVKKLLHDWSI